MVLRLWKLALFICLIINEDKQEVIIVILLIISDQIEKREEIKELKGYTLRLLCGRLAGNSYIK